MELSMAHKLLGEVYLVGNVELYGRLEDVIIRSYIDFHERGESTKATDPLEAGLLVVKYAICVDSYL